MTYASDFRELAPLLMRKDGGEAANEIDEAAPTSKAAQEEAAPLSSEDEDKDPAGSKSKGSSWNPFSISLDPWADKKERDAIIDRELNSIKDFFNIFNPDNFKTKAGGGRIYEQSQIASRSEGGGLSTIYKATGGRSSRSDCFNEYGQKVPCESLEDPASRHDPPEDPKIDILGLDAFHSSYDREPIDLAVAGLSALGFHGAGPFLGITTQHARQNYVNSIRAQYDLEPLGFFSIGMTKEEQQYPITAEELARKGQYGDLGTITGGYGRLGREPTEQEIQDWTKPSGLLYDMWGRNPYDIMMQEIHDERDKSVREQQEAVKNRGAAASQVAAMYGATPVDPPVGPPDLIDEGVPTNVWDELAEQPIQTIIDDTFIDATIPSDDWESYTDFGDDDSSSDNDTSDDYSSWF